MDTWLIEEYERSLVEEATKDLTDRVSRDIAKNFKGFISDSEIAKRTGLSLEVVKGL